MTGRSTGWSMAGLMLLVLGTVAVAQTTPDPVPTIDLTPMFDTIAPAPPVPEATPVVPVSIPQYDRDGAAAASPAPSTVLLPLQSAAPGRIVRLSGETASATFTVDVPDTAAVTAFYLSYRTSIDVLPEHSQLAVTVNGNPVPAVKPVPAEGFEKLSLPVNLLKKGQNDVELAVTQAHRIYCGPEASFQIWSDFDLNASGVELAQGRLALNETGFRTALTAQAVGGHGVPLRGGARVSADGIADLATRLSGFGAGAGGWLRAEEGYGPAPATHDLARISVIAGPRPGVTLRQGADGVMVLAVVLGADGALPAGIDRFLPAPGTVADVAALVPGTKVSFADIGFPDTPDADHYMRHDLPFRLPTDWLILASQRAAMTLLYSFADNLPKGALLLVKINGTTVQLLPLDRNGGKVQPPLNITFPARLLHPGANVVTFESTVPGDPANLPCPPPTGTYLTILGQSDLIVPASPRMRFTALVPTLLALPQAAIAVPGAADDKAEALKMALLAQMRPLTGQAALTGASLTLTTAAGADQVPSGDLGLTPRDLAAILAAPASPPQAPVTGPASYTALVTDLVYDLAHQIWAIARPGDAGLHGWLAGRRGDAALFMPDTADPARLWLVVSPTADPAGVARALAQARTDPYGPKGQLAILSPDGTWQSWQAAASPPELLEPLGLDNFRFVVGNYASWSPLYFVLLLAALTALSVVFAVVFVVTTRGGRKR